MEESLSDMIRKRDELQHQMQVLEAISSIVERIPGATTLEDAERLTGRPWLDLLVEETGLTPEQVEKAAAASAPE